MRLAWAYLPTDCLRLYGQPTTQLTFLSLTLSTNTHAHVSQCTIAHKLENANGSIENVDPQGPRPQYSQWQIQIHRSFFICFANSKIRVASGSHVAVWRQAGMNRAIGL